MEMALLRKKLKVAKDKLEQMTENVEPSTRAVRDAFEKALSGIGVDTTKYFSGNSLVGGAAIKFLEKRVDFFDKALKYLDETKAASIRSRFLPLMALLEDPNREARRATILSDQQVDDIEVNISLFCNLYLATLQTTQATPKLHILEAHLVEFMRKWRALGLFGEDAIESIHAKLNAIYRRVHGIRNRVRKQQSAWWLLDGTQLASSIKLITKSKNDAKRKFAEPDEARTAKRAKRKEEKDAATNQQP